MRLKRFLKRWMSQECFNSRRGNKRPFFLVLQYQLSFFDSTYWGFSGGARQPALFSQTRFFFRRKNGFEAPVKEPKGNLSKRFPLDTFENKGAAAPLRPRGCTIAPRKDFAEQKCFAAVESTDLPLGTKIVAARPNRHCVKMRKRVLTILVRTLFYICTTNIELHGSLRGRSPSVEEGFKREPLGVPFAVSFFCEAFSFFCSKERKCVEPAGKFCRNLSGPWATPRQ